MFTRSLGFIGDVFNKFLDSTLKKSAQSINDIGRRVVALFCTDFRQGCPVNAGPCRHLVERHLTSRFER